MRHTLPLIVLCLAVLPATAQKKDGGLPLEADRAITIDRTSGSWISIDVSPDGETIAFDYLGDLFTLPIAGGAATQITSGLAFDAQPRFSPDGTQLVFTSDRDGGQNIWTMTLADSTFKQISKGASNRAESPEWMPDGEYIVASMGGFRGGGQPKLNLFHVDGGGGAQLVSEPANLKMLGAAPSPDGNHVWYARRTGDWQYNAQFPQYQIEAYDRETGQRHTKTSRYGSAIRPTLSPDGRLLVFGTRHDEHTGLMVRDLDSGEDRWLAYPVQHDDQESRATLDVLPGMSFTPDSQHLVASYGGKIWKLPVAGGDAEEIPFQVTFDLDLGPKVFFDYPIDDTPTFTVRQIRDAVPSPDGSMLAFTAMDRLWVSAADGSNPRRVTDDDRSEHYPAWSPDGTQLAYATWDGESGHLWAARTDGRGSARQLTMDAGLYFSPAWSANGRVVAQRGFAETYESQGAEGPPGQDLVWVPVDGGPSAATVIMSTGGRRGPHFVRGSDRIYLQRGDALVSIRWDGTDEKEIVRVRGPRPAGSTSGLFPSVLKMAPQGDQALAEIQRHMYTVTVPMVGKTITINVGNPASASFPARKLTDIGGEFPAWGADGRTVHYSLGNAHFIYSLDDADAYADSVKAAKKAEEEAPEEPDEEPDEDAEEDPEEEESDEEEKEDEGYKPVEVRIQIQATRDIPQGAVVLRGGRVITMNGNEVIGRGDVVIENNRITAVGVTGSVAAPADATVIDVTGKTIVPGYVDTHAHLRARDGIHRTDVWPFLANLAYGVTLTRDPQTGNTEVLSYSDMVRAGQVLGPRVYSTGPGVFWQDGIDTEEEAYDILKRYSDYFDTKTIKMYVAAARKGRQHIIKAARELELMPTTEGSLNLKQNITETLDGYPGLEHSLPIFPVYEDYLDIFVATSRVYTPTLLVSYGGPWAENYFYSRENPHDDAKTRRFVPHNWVDQRTRRRGQWFHEDEHVFERHAVFVKDLVEAGGYAGVGSHGQFQGIGWHWELWAMASGGLSNHDALKVATIQGAFAIGLAQDLGSIEAGKLADLVILNSNPLDDLRSTADIDHVMINGRLFEGDTLNEVYPRQRDLAPLWWWDDEPTSDLPGTGQ
ncbi:MAG: PD40 domain-containing protein [Rhodothermales bacterium]|nr:PD40 domain-containing protein [Rhodothermales bacterium]MBO6779975.1 PD40 domain-containing protein [Rhodothermales bacterium]